MKITQNPQGKWELGSQGNIYDTKEEAEAALAATGGQQGAGSAQDKDDKNAGTMGAKKDEAQTHERLDTVYQDEEGKWGFGSQGNIYDTKEEALAEQRRAKQVENEARTHGQKSLASSFSKPPKVEACVRRLVADPNFKPKTKGQSKESAAWAVCQSTLNKAIDDIYEAMIILRHFEEPDEYSLVDPDDYSSYGEKARKDLEVSNDSLTEDGNPLPPELSGLTTSDLTNVPNAPVDVNLNNPQEPANMLGGLNPDSDTSTDVTNVTDNPLI